MLSHIYVIEKKCDNCSTECTHTTDISHAANFEKLPTYDGIDKYFEIEREWALPIQVPPKESGWYCTTVWTGEELSMIEAYYNVQDNSWIVDGFDLIGVLAWMPVPVKSKFKAKALFHQLGFEPVEQENGHLMYEKRVPDRDFDGRKNSILYVEFDTHNIDYDFCYDFINSQGEEEIEYEDMDLNVFKAIFAQMVELGWIKV